jgi:hypothetical protein
MIRPKQMTAEGYRVETETVEPQVYDIIDLQAINMHLGLSSRPS